MRKIIVSEFYTLDGVIEAPHEWSFPYWNEEIAKYKHEELFSAGALLLGRITYDGFAAAWPDRKDAEGYADRINAMQKYVVSKTLDKLGWSNSNLIKGDIIEEIRKIKEGEGADIFVFGSAQLTQLLIKNNLVDEYRLLVYPVVLGKGKRLFQDEAYSKLKLTENKPFGTGVVGLHYEALGKSEK